MHTRHFSIYIAAGPDQVWQALINPAMTRRYYAGLAVESNWQPGSPITYRSDPPRHAGHRLAGEIVHVEPGRRLVHSLLTDADADPEVQCWLTWELEEREPGLCRMGLTCDDLDRYPDAEGDEGWSRLLSGLKTAVETGA
jgi:uncharacterized protein YndB with AHSA1/START domain